MKQRLILVMVVCLLAGIGGGYTAGYALYVPKIRSYATQVSELTSQVFNLEQSVSSLEQEISSLEQEVSNQKAQIATKEGQINSLESEQASLKSDLTAARDQVWEALEEARTLKSELSSSKQQLTNVLGIKVIQSYQWDYGMETWEWNLQIPLSLYVEYRDRRRQPLGASWVNMAKDTGDDLYIDQITQRINETAMENGFTEPQKINFVIAFVQNLPYTVDSETTPWNEYPRYPIETLFDRGGDCEDTSILVAALLDRMGYDVALLALTNAKHMAVGISMPSTYGTYYEYGGKKYYYLETTGDGWEIGDFPPSITDADARAYIYPLKGS